MASSKRERELARMRAERQAARRAEAAARRRRQRTTGLSVLAAVAVVAIAVGAFVLTRGTPKKDTLKTASPAASAGATAAPVARTCSYPAAGKASKPVLGGPPTVPVRNAETARLLTSRGEIDLALDGTKAPCTVGSFAFLAGQHYFDGTSCHRLTTTGIFVLQCGDPSGTGSGGPGYAYADENLTGATYPRGTLAMANAGKGTNGSQFFLVYKDTKLPPSYTPFGTITKGLDLLAKVAAGGAKPTGDGKPTIPVLLKTVTVKPT